MKSNEKATQKAILDYLALTGVFHWRNNSGAMRTEHGSFVRFGAAGSPDIVVVLPPHGQLLGIEVKDGRGSLSATQKAFRDALEAVGGLYLVARSLDDVTSFLHSRRRAA